VNFSQTVYLFASYSKQHNLLKENILPHTITEKQFVFCEVENEFLYNLEEIREFMYLKLP
jgi:hypothetical protein